METYFFIAFDCFLKKYFPTVNNTKFSDILLKSLWTERNSVRMHNYSCKKTVERFLSFFLKYAKTNFIICMYIFSRFAVLQSFSLTVIPKSRLETLPLKTFSEKSRPFIEKQSFLLPLPDYC